MAEPLNAPAPAPPAVPSAAAAAAPDATRTVLIIDGAYAHIGARRLEGSRIDYVKLRSVLEGFAGSRLRECWFFDQEPIAQRSAHQSLSAQYTALKLAPPHGPQFQLKLYAMKKYQCHCRRCGHQFHQLVQKGVDNGIATKILSLAYENICDRFILFAGDGDFYDSLNQIKNVLRKDLWVVGYRDTVSADLQQLASHVLWANDLWSQIKIPSSPGAAAPNESEEEEGEVSEEEHAPRRPQKKRGRDRQVHVTSQQQPAAAASNDTWSRRDSHRARQQRSGASSGGGEGYHRYAAAAAAAAGGVDSVSPRQRNSVQPLADSETLNARGVQLQQQQPHHLYAGDASGGDAPPTSSGHASGGYQQHPHLGNEGVHPHAANGAPLLIPPPPPGRPRGGSYRRPPGDLPPNPANGAAPARYNDSGDDADRVAPRGGRRYPRGKRQRNGEPRAKRDEFQRDGRPLSRPGVLGAVPGESSKEGDASARIPSAPLSFAMSDVSSSGDEDEKYVMPPVAKMAKVTVIDLASDSESE